jgi:Fis family transcriptional regulator, factor for inversion stimulation protein
MLVFTRSNHPIYYQRFEDIMNSDSAHAIPLRQHVQITVSRYLKDMGKTAPENLYQMLLAEIEPPLIEEILKCTGGNQSRAAEMLGITRNTLRTKMQRYSIKARSGKIPRSGR